MHVTPDRVSERPPNGGLSVSGTSRGADHGIVTRCPRPAPFRRPRMIDEWTESFIMKDAAAPESRR
jgi:hypothetical protein